MIQGFTITYGSTDGRSLILYHYPKSDDDTESQVQTDGRTYARNIPAPITRNIVDVLHVAMFITANGISHPRSNSFNIVGCSENTRLITSGNLDKEYRIYMHISQCQLIKVAVGFDTQGCIVDLVKFG